MGGPHVTKEVEEIICKAYTECQKATGDDNPTGKEVQRRAELIKKREGLTHINIPRIRKIYYVLEKIRERHTKMIESGRNIDVPWSMSYASEVPPEYVPAVLGVWKLRQTMERGFLIREALWTARLSGAIDDLYNLSTWSRIYANRELVSSLLNQEFETADLDVIWSTSAWELATMYLTEKAKLPVGFYEGDLLYPPSIRASRTRDTSLFFVGSGLIELDDQSVHIEANKAEHFLVLGPNYLDEIWGDDNFSDEPLDKDQIYEEMAKDLEQLDTKFTEVYGNSLDYLGSMPIEDVGLSIEAERVYTLWLHYLYSKSDEKKLLPADRLDILKELRLWISNHRLATSSEDLQQSMFKINISSLGKLVNEFDLEPAELLIRVGYNL